jgi:type II restriction/modification system DNA methylase subunit YeeA
MVLDGLFSAARRERAEAIKTLEEAIKDHGEKQVIERVAYIWFNRFCALRFMDVNRYNRVSIVSPADPGQFQPEILAEAKMGHIDDEMVHEKVRRQVFALLDGKAPSRDPQGEAYRLLVVAACNYWNKAMPFLFQRIDDYTELLMPDDLLSGNSILAYTREAMTPDACKDVEVIGWLYQFYISEKKDEVFDGLKNNKKITPENIPAATQLFTPHWIVRYLVENSLGRLWLLNRPGSKLAGQMDYYIKPEQSETDFLRIAMPEEIKICDPACGSGHMLTYAFDLLYAIYEEEGYEPTEIPEKILTNNLYGIEIDERAGELSAFALTMKARAKQRRFFNKEVIPNICVLENIHFDESDLKNYMDFVGRDLFTAPLQTTLRQFEEADNFGSLIRPDVTDVGGMLAILESKNVSGQLFISMTHQKVLQALRQADYLSPKYHVVIANPPYMGGKGMNGLLGAWAKDNYPNSKSDLYSMFIERILSMIQQGGHAGFMTPFTWMFLTSFETLRSILLNNHAITGLVRPEYHSFFESAYVPICCFTVFNRNAPNLAGAFIDLSDFYGADVQPVKLLEAVNDYTCGWFYTATPNDFLKIPSNPIAYWISEKARDLFEKCLPLGHIANAKQGLITGDNEQFLRFWNEIALEAIGFDCRSRDEALESGKRWFPHHKGGTFRKWYGNHEYVVDWENDGDRIRNFFDDNGKLRSRPQNLDFYFKSAVTWTSLTVASFNGRLSRGGFIYDAKGPMVAPCDSKYFLALAGLLNCNVSSYLLKLLAPTMDYNQGPVSKLPWPNGIDLRINAINHVIGLLEAKSQVDWDAYETSWDFTSHPLLNNNYQQPTLKATYQNLRDHWREMTLEMQRLEEENNRIFIEAYGLQDELTSEVPLNEITLTCNPNYRYGKDKSEEELEALLLADTMRELVSYAVGCMFGRYALDKPGLILANQGETIEDYLKRVKEPSFPADEDNVIPMLDGDWFTDDIADRFRKFLRVAFGEERYEENLRFVEQGLNIKGKRNYTIRDYFLGEFYADHVKRYKKRPIYWLFSSPNGSFNALIYMHRYRSDTVSMVLNEYLREFRTKLSSHKNNLEAISISAGSSQVEKTKALKEIEKITRMIAEMKEYEEKVLYPLATKQVDIDLDDGVKVNYTKLGAALKKIPGLEASEDE